MHAEATLDPCFLCGITPALTFDAVGTATWTHLCPGHPAIPNVGHEWTGRHGYPDTHQAVLGWEEFNDYWRQEWQRMRAN